MELLCTIRVFYTVHVWYILYAYNYAYGTTVREWYGYLYHMSMASYYTITDYKQHIAIAITVTVLLFILDHEFYPRCSFLLIVIFCEESLR